MKGYNKFKVLLVSRGIKQVEIATLLNMSRSRFNLIINGQRNKDFKVHEVTTICEYLEISAGKYFFNEKVSL